MMIYRLFPALIVLAAFAAPASAEEIASTYTKLVYEDCKELPSSDPGVIDIRECEGFGGFKVRWGGGPDESWVAFSETDLAQQLDLGSFYIVNETVGRGPVLNGTIKPKTAIVRYWTGPNIGSLPNSSLVVYRLSGVPCAVAVVPGETPKANEVARRTADAGTTACLK